MREIKFLIFLGVIALGEAGTGVNCNSKKPALTPGQTYTVNQNCPLGSTYNTAAPPQHCHCWSFCGYICEATTAAPGPAPAPAPATTAASTCKGPSTIPAGSKWVSNPGCGNGNTYNDPTGFHCHCWGHCGYICDPRSAPAPATTRKPATTAAACKQPPASRIPAGSKWVSNPGCGNGNTYNDPTGFHCHCWGHCGYICDPRAAPATTKSPATTAAACKQPPASFIPSGSKWVSNPGCGNGNTYNDPTGFHCHCWGHCGYICDPRSAPATTRKPATTAAACKQPPASLIPSGSKWVSNPGCSNGGTYNDPTGFHCHCWGDCGYICDPRAAPTTKSPVVTTKNPGTTAAACKAPPASSIPSGSHWVLSPGCPSGTTYNTPTNPPFHCHCWGHCGYICDPRGGSSGGATGGTTPVSGATDSSASTDGSTTDVTVGSSTDGSSTDSSTDGSTTDATTDGSTTDATTDGSTTDATTDGSTTDATTDGSTTDATTDGSTTDATTDGSTTDATTDGSTTDATTDGSTTATPP